MKKLFTLLIICLLFSGCKKEVYEFSKLTGNYNFTIHETIYGPPPNLATTFYYSGKVSTGKSNDHIILSFLENFSVEPKIYEDGYLELHIGYESGLSGEFESTSLVTFYYSSGGLGSGVNYNVTGIKTK